MLGAVRHQGVIPWDGDLDIGMIESNYQQFLKACKTDLQSSFLLDNYTTNPDNALVFSIIRLLRTRYIENKDDRQAVHSEILVDVFSYYFRLENAAARKIEVIEMAVMAQSIMSKVGCLAWKGDSPVKRLKFIPTDLLGSLCSR